MLKVMRDSFQHLKWILVFVIAVFIFFIFAEWGGGGGSSGTDNRNDSVIAKVNGETIGVRDFDRGIFYAIKNYEQLYGQNLNPEILRALNVPQQVVDSLVDRTLLMQEAEKLGLTATEGEVRKKIYEIPILNPNGQFLGADAYKRYVTVNLGFSSAAEFEEEIAEQVTLDKLESALFNAVVISPGWAEAEYRRRNEDAKIKYLLYPAEKSLGQVTVTPAEVESYYRANASTYSHPEQRQVKYLQVDAAQLRSAIKASDAELRTAYESSKETYQTKEMARAQHILIKPAGTTPAEDAAAKQKADALLQQIRGGSDFGALAKANSGDPGSAVNGGDLGLFERGQMVPEFEQAAFALQPGQVSDVVKSQFGYHIIKLTETRAGGLRPFEEVRPELETKVIEQKAKAEAQQLATGVKARITETKPKTDEQFRALTGPSVKLGDTGWFAKGGAITGLGRNAQLAEWAFSAKVGDVGEVIETPQGPIVPWVGGTRPAGVSALEEMRSKVEIDAKSVKARQAAKDVLTAALTGKTLEDAGLALSIAPVDATVNRQGAVQGLTGNTSALVEAALSAKIGQQQGPVIVDQGAIAFRVLEQKRFDPVAYNTEKSSFISTMRVNEARKLRASLLAKLKKAADITINERALQERSGTPATT